LQTPDYLLGIDLGGTKIEVAVLSKRNLQVIDRHRIATESDKGYDHITERIHYLVDFMVKKYNLNLKYVGLGTPGTLDPSTHTMKNCNTTSLNGKDFKTDLEKILNQEVRISNDANCFAIAESLLGVVPEVSKDAKVVFGVIMGTGVGGGLVVDGKVIGGRHGIGGEWGHNFLDESGGLCYCGKIGCVERLIAGPSLEQFYFELTGVKRELKEIVDRYRKGVDNQASTTMNKLFADFGRAIAVVINIVDPDVIVIGGGVGNIDELYTLGVNEVKKHIFNPQLDTIFAKPKLGDSAGVFGAALL
jgi:fructokinase